MGRIGSIAIIIEGNKECVANVNKILSDFADCVTARMGVPNHKKNISVISLIVDIDTETLGALTGKLGNLKGVTVKSMLTTKSYDA